MRLALASPAAKISAPKLFKLFCGGSLRQNVAAAFPGTGTNPLYQSGFKKRIEQVERTLFGNAQRALQISLGLMLSGIPISPV